MLFCFQHSVKSSCNRVMMCCGPVAAVLALVFLHFASLGEYTLFMVKVNYIQPSNNWLIFDTPSHGAPFISHLQGRPLAASRFRRKLPPPAP